MKWKLKGIFKLVHVNNEWWQSSTAWCKINVMGRRRHLFLLLLRYRGLSILIWFNSEFTVKLWILLHTMQFLEPRIDHGHARFLHTTLSLEGGRSVIIKNTVFWDLTTCELVDGPNVSGEPAAYPGNVGRNCFRNFGTTYQTTRFQISWVPYYLAPPWE